MKTRIIKGRAYGFSMQPLIQPGDLLIIKKMSMLKVCINDILVFYDGKRYISHRAIWKNGRRWIVKGDNSPIIDLPFSENKFIGKVIEIKGKKYHINLTSPLAKIVNGYFLYYSLATFIPPYLLRKLLLKTIRGRRLLVSLLKNKNTT